MPVLSLSRRQLIVTSCGAALIMRPLRQAWSAEETVALDDTVNPYSPSDDTKVVLRDGAAGNGAESMAALKQAIAERHGLKPENILICAGAAALLGTIAAAYTGAGKKLVCGSPSLPAMADAAARAGGTPVAVPITRDMRLDLATMQTQAMDGAVYLCNPNDPTGTLVDGSALRAFIAAVSPKALIIVDETYIEFTDNPAQISAVDQVRAGQNVVICRDFSRTAGLKDHPVAYALARADIISRLAQTNPPLPEALAAKAAFTSYQDTDFASYSRQMVRACTAYTRALFSQLGVKQVPTQANFVMFDTGRAPGAFSTYMRARNILVADVPAPYTTWCRVGMGLMQDMERFADATRAFYKT